MDFYAILGIPRNADEQEIRTAFRMLARRYHPDRGAGSSSERFRQIVEAYETLANPSRRHDYDLSLVPPSPSLLHPEPMIRPEPISQWETPFLKRPHDGWIDELLREFDDDFFA